MSIFAKKELELIHPLVQQYAEDYSTAEEDILKEISAFTVETNRASVMLSGHVQGKLLQMISSMIKPRRILEVGTFTGYSAYCLAKGLTDDGLLHSIELREKDAEVARGFLDKTPVADKIIIHTGNALEIIPTLNETWDLVFIDADKTGYIEYFDMVLPKVKQNGFILADNIFFHGDVLEENVKGKNAIAIKGFNEYIKSRTDIEKVILTIRDGLYLLKKL
jgi:caffeoyl-CoA O-methyltransferase